MCLTGCSKPRNNKPGFADLHEERIGAPAARVFHSRNFNVSYFSEILPQICQTFSGCVLPVLL